MTSDIESRTKHSICFVSLDNYATLVDDPMFGHIGGAEMQQTLIGRNLAKRGYRVSFITLDHSQDNELEIDGMRIIKAYAQNTGIRGLRFLHPRLTSLWRAMKGAHADVYYQRTRDSMTGIVAAFCRLHGRKFVFAAAHDYDCMTDPPCRQSAHERVLYHYGLHRANLVIAQTMTQKRLLRENFDVNSMIIPNFAVNEGRCAEGVDIPPSSRGKRLLWIGMFKPAKRLELLLDIAEQCPDFQFDVIGDGSSKFEYVKNLRYRAKSLPNIHLHGIIPHAAVRSFYQEGAALICTSSGEGFPNIFLEAWANGLPVVSTFDPDNLIEAKNVGIVARDAKGLVSEIRTLLGDSQRWQKVSKAAHQYYLDNHTTDVIVPKFECILDKAANII